MDWNNHSINALNFWSFESGMGLEFFSMELGRTFTALNVYGPYLNQVPLWDTIFHKFAMEDDSIIFLGGG